MYYRWPGRSVSHPLLCTVWRAATGWMHSIMHIWTSPAATEWSSPIKNTLSRHLPWIKQMVYQRRKGKRSFISRIWYTIARIAIEFPHRLSDDIGRCSQPSSDRRVVMVSLHRRHSLACDWTRWGGACWGPVCDGNERLLPVRAH